LHRRRAGELQPFQVEASARDLLAFDVGYAVPFKIGAEVVTVVGYQRGITLSPTVMGEGYLVKGRPAFYFLLLVGSVVLLWFDSLYERTRGGLPYFVGAFVYSAFFFIREGFSELLLRTIFVGVFFAFYLVIRQVVSSPVRRP